MVNDADKELFIKVADMEHHADDILAGRAYTWEVDAIAEYREQAAKEERAKIVAWLRDQGICSTEFDDASGWWDTSTGAKFGENVLKLIEAGEHFGSMSVPRLWLG